MKRETKAQRRRRVLRNRVLAIVFLLALLLVVVLVINAVSGKKKSMADSAGAAVQANESASDSAGNTIETTGSAVGGAGNPDDTAQTPSTDSSMVKFDTNPPVITAPQVIYVSIGDTVAYKSYVHVEDDYDPDPEITVDNSKVNLGSIGNYVVTYTATDASGNSSDKTVSLIVNEAMYDAVSEDVINQAADELLDSIVSDDMTDMEKILAIFFHVRDSYTYTQDDGKLEYKQEAYKFMTTGKDSCYANVCLSKLLLERCGYESVMVQGPLSYLVYDEQEYHYWNLVSIDNGENWYVYDSAWWTWQDDEYPLCMMTAEMAQKISDRHDGLYNYDPDDYPAISNVPLWDPAEEGYVSWYE